MILDSSTINHVIDFATKAHNSGALPDRVAIEVGQDWLFLLLWGEGKYRMVDNHFANTLAQMRISDKELYKL